MTGPLDSLQVLDLTQAVAGPIATMLLADQGADVVKIEPPGGDRSRSESGARVWHRGKRSAVLDLAEQRDAFLALADQADVLVESFAPGTTERLGIDAATLRARNPRLVYCSITAYGRDNRHADRPGFAHLVAARTGMVWEQRGWVGGVISRMTGSAPNLPDLVAPDGCWDGTDRPGPIFPYTSFPSLAAAYLATTAISAALHVREVTGVGQWVETSLLQGVLAATCGGWQRAEHPDAFFYDTWIFDSRATRGLFECSDGRWVCHWVPNPAFVLGVSEGDELRATSETRAPRDDPTRIAPSPEELVVLHHYHPQMAAAFRRFPADEWARVGAEVGVALQPVRTPEEALADPALLDCGSVVALDDPDLGAVRQVGITYRLHDAPATLRGGPPAVGQHTDEVLAHAAAGAAISASSHETASGLPDMSRPADAGSRGEGPLAGITVLDLGLAVAGPWGTQLLGDLGADVIKINALHDGFWHSTHIAMACNRSKRSLAVNLKDPRGMAALHRLVERADIVQHNMRYVAAQRLGVDFESLRAINPQLIYCHTKGFDPSRAHLPGNDQTGAALAGVVHEDGGCDAGGRPIWSLTSLGDLGNGFLSAIAMCQALYHRDRTGLGQFVDTSILDAQLLNASYAWLAADGTPAPRAKLDAEQLGVTALYRLYDTADGWLCLAVLSDSDWAHLCTAIAAVDAVGDDLRRDERFAAVDGRREHDAELWKTLEAVFAQCTAAEWFDRLDGAGVPCEIASDTFALDLFDDPEMIERGWVTSYRQGHVGELHQFGRLFDFSATPARITRAPLVVGDHSVDILRELGYAEGDIRALIDDGVVVDAASD